MQESLEHRPVGIHAMHRTQDWLTVNGYVSPVYWGSTEDGVLFVMLFVMQRGWNCCCGASSWPNEPQPFARGEELQELVFRVRRSHDFACLSLGPGWISSESTSPVELSWWGRGCSADIQLPQLRPWVIKDPRNWKESIVEMTAIVAGLPLSFLKSTTISIVFRLPGLRCRWKLEFSLIIPCYTTA